MKVNTLQIELKLWQLKPKASNLLKYHLIMVSTTRVALYLDVTVRAEVAVRWKLRVIVRQKMTVLNLTSSPVIAEKDKKCRNQQNGKNDTDPGK